MRLVYYEGFDDVHKAIGREKQLERLDSGEEDRANRIKESAMGGSG